MINDYIHFLKKAPLYKGMDFHEGLNDLFMQSMGEDFDKIFSHAYGATKFVLIPKEEDQPFVFKIPYTGNFYEDSSYYFYKTGALQRSSYGKKLYTPFSNADTENGWDYCNVEVLRYARANNANLEKCFAQTKFLMYINGYPIYVQEKCKTFAKESHLHELDLINHTMDISNSISKRFYTNWDWLTDFYIYYGEEILKKFIIFLRNLGWDDDLRSENIGYINNRPVLIDYSSYLEEF